MPSSPADERFSRLRRTLGFTALAVFAACAWCHGVVFVEGGSMRPALHPGDVIVYRRLGSEPRVGDMAVYEHRGALVVHRVVGATRDGGLRTRGDANDSPDPGTVRPEWLRGDVVLVVPIGRVVEYLVVASP